VVALAARATRTAAMTKKQSVARTSLQRRASKSQRRPASCWSTGARLRAAWQRAASKSGILQQSRWSTALPQFGNDRWGDDSALGRFRGYQALARPDFGWPLVSLVSAALLWVISVRSVDESRIGSYGLVPLFPITFVAALAILIVSFCLFVYRDRAPAAILVAHVVALIVILHGTPLIVYDHLRYSWAWKHVGIVDYIQRNGTVDPDIGLFNAYHNWPGFFAFAALVTEAAGFESALGLAAWAPVIFNILFLGAVFLLLRLFTTDRRLIWLGLWFYFLTQWVGQDYFAPQPLAYVLHLIILWICLAWLGRDAIQPRVSIWLWRPSRFVLSLLDRVLGRAKPADPPTTEPPLWQQQALLGTAILLFAVIATSHQLTPFMTILAVSALVVFDRCRVRGLPLLFIVLTVAWMISGALVFTQEHVLAEIEAFGQTEGNISSTLIDTSRADPSMRVVALAGRALSASVGLLAFLGILRRLWHRYRDLVPMLLCGSPLLVLAGSSYGGEVVFRVYLFALPFLAFFAAALIYPAPAAGRSWWGLLLSILLSGAMLAGFGLAYYGKEEINHYTDGEVAATRYLYRIVPSESLIIEGTSTYPIRDKYYDRFSYVPIVVATDDPSHSQCSYTADELVSLMADPVYPGTTERAPAAFLIVTRSQLASIRLLGACSIDSLINEVANHPCVQTVFLESDALILTVPPESLGRDTC
jgi:hypothetical protein